MDSVVGTRRHDCEASGSGLHARRDPDAPPLDRILPGRKYNHLDLAWAPDGVSRAGGRRPKTARVLLRGHLVAPPPILPHEKGKGPLLPLGGTLRFCWIHADGHVFRLHIERPNHVWEVYYCNLLQPLNRDGWHPSHRRADEARDYDGGRTRADTRESLDSVLDTWRAPSPPPERAASPLRIAPPSLRQASASGSAPAAWVADTTTAMVRAAEFRPPVPAAFTPQEAGYQLRRLMRTLEDGSRLVWGSHLGRDLLAVVQVPQPRRPWPFRAGEPGKTERIYHLSLHGHWDAGSKARVLGGGTFPPTRAGEGTTVESFGESYTGGEWVLEWSIAEEGQAVATINERRASLCMLSE